MCSSDLLQFARPDDGVFGGQVRLERPGVVMLKATYNPAWQARVDGRTVPTQMLAPSFVGVPVPAGAHTVEFRYRESPLSWPLLAFGVIALAALALVPRFLERRRAGATSPEGDEAPGPPDAPSTDDPPPSLIVR